MKCALVVLVSVVAALNCATAQTTGPSDQRTTPPLELITESTPESVFTRGLKPPNYPSLALRYGGEARIISHITIDADCKPSGLAFVAIEAPKNLIQHFKKSVQDAYSAMAPKCTEVRKPPFVVEQEFSFSITPRERTRYELTSNSMELGGLLTLFNSAPAFGPIDLRNGACGKQVVVQPLMPDSPNQITRAADADLPMAEMVHWLSKLTLKKEHRLDFLGKRMLLTIPCATLDLK